jgi:hypothetical protein
MASKCTNPMRPMPITPTRIMSLVWTLSIFIRSNVVEEDKDADDKEEEAVQVAAVVLGTNADGEKADTTAVAKRPTTTRSSNRVIVPSLCIWYLCCLFVLWMEDSLRIRCKVFARSGPPSSPSACGWNDVCVRICCPFSFQLQAGFNWETSIIPGVPARSGYRMTSVLRYQRMMLKYRKRGEALTKLYFL